MIRNPASLMRRSASHGHLHVVKFLVEKGADIHALNDCALQWSAMSNHLHIVKYLVAQGASIHADDDNAARTSAHNGHLEVVKFLVENGANVRAGKDDALRYSVMNGHLEMAKYLMYEVCYGEARDFDFKYNLIKTFSSVSHFEGEYRRRKAIQIELDQKLYDHALLFHLRPTSLRVQYMDEYFGRHFSDRQYWE